LFFAKACADFARPQIQFFDAAVAIAQVRVEFAFTKSKDVGAKLEPLLVEFGEAVAVALFKSRAALAFLERLHSQGFGDVGYRFR
jgi:hypothetical protein